MSPLLALLVVAAPLPTTVVAVMPPATDQAGNAWFGLAFADELEARLLAHTVNDPATNKDIYPVSVFGWRQTVAAAREAGITPDHPLTFNEGRDVARALGAVAVFSGTYVIKTTSIRLIWRLLGVGDGLSHELEIPLDEVGVYVGRIYPIIIREAGLHGLGVTVDDPPERPFAALRAYGEALGILRQQSLDPRARIVLSDAQLDAAHVLLSEATRLSPGFGRAWVWRAITSSMRGVSKRSADELQSAREAGEADTPAEALAVYYAFQRGGQPEKAILYLGSTLNHHLGFLLGLGYLAQAYMHANKPGAALQLFTLYQQRVPGNAWVPTMKAECLARLDRHDEALSELVEAQRRFPDSMLVLSGIAVRFLEMGRIEDARRSLTAALARSPNSPQLLARLAHLELESGHLAKAAALAPRAAAGVDTSRGEPEAGYPYLILGRVLAHQGRTADAVEAFETALHLGLGTSELRRLREDPFVAEALKDPRLASIK